MKVVLHATNEETLQLFKMQQNGFVVDVECKTAHTPTSNLETKVGLIYIFRLKSRCEQSCGIHGQVPVDLTPSTLNECNIFK